MNATPHTDEQAAGDTLELRVCQVCDQAGTKQCGQCRQVAYCSAACQTQDWQQHHKYECGFYKDDAYALQVHEQPTEEYPALVSAARAGTNATGETFTTHIRAVTWDTDATANNYSYEDWLQPENAIALAWRDYIRQLVLTGQVPQILLISLQAVHRKNGFYRAMQTFLEEETGEIWTGAQVYDENMVRSVTSLYQSQQLVFWIPRRVQLQVWKKATTCFGLGALLGVDCEYGAAGLYMTYRLTEDPQAPTAPVPLVAVSAHFSPHSRTGRIRAYRQIMNRLVPKLLAANKLEDHIRPPTDCATILVAGDMGWRRKTGTSTRAPDPLTLARLGDTPGGGLLFPAPEWAEVGQPGSGRLPLTREFTPAYRETCPMETAETFEPGVANRSVLTARLSGTDDAFSGAFPKTHCDRVFLRFPTNVYTTSAQGWTQQLLVPQSINGRHEAVDIHIPYVLEGETSCIGAPVVSLIGSTMDQVACGAVHVVETWHDPLAIERALRAHHGRAQQVFLHPALPIGAHGETAGHYAGRPSPTVAELSETVATDALLAQIEFATVLYERMTGQQAMENIALDPTDTREWPLARVLGTSARTTQCLAAQLRAATERTRWGVGSQSAGEETDGE